jgi:hypothetical protein
VTDKLTRGNRSWAAGWLGSIAAVLQLAGCTAYRVIALPEIEERPAVPTAVCIVAPSDLPGRYNLNWVYAARLAGELEQAGFTPCIVRELAQVPAGTPVIEDFEFNDGICANPMLLTSVLSATLLPGRACSSFGLVLDLRRSAGEPPAHVDTRFDYPYVVWILAPLLTVLPEYTFAPPYGLGLERERRALRAALLDALAPR